MSSLLPTHFCWTRFGTEAGESVAHILARKERDVRETTASSFGASATPWGRPCGSC